MGSIDSIYVWFKNLSNRINKKKGQAAVEYALILGGIVVAVIITAFAFGESVNKIYQLFVNIFN